MNYFTAIDLSSRILLKILSTLILVLSSLVFASTGLSQTVHGKVISVADGDTITILTSQNKKVKIRLYGIDCPEKGQAYGNKAKKFTASLTAGIQALIKIYDTDRYGRSVGVVFVGGTNVNQEIIRNGYGWQYRKYCKASFCNEWLGLENSARDAHIGLWRANNPVAPWVHRKSKRSTSGKSNVVGGAGIYHGNKKSHVFHSSRCRYYNCKNCTVVFKSVNDAIRAGYRAHKQCVN